MDRERGAGRSGRRDRSGRPAGTTGGLPSGDLPVALAAVSVDGRCRERSPADLAIFGPGRDRLVGRFAEPAEGQALLARAVEAGAAEGVGHLVTEAGARHFRISLWRQRGGERIRIVAAFAALDETRDDTAEAGGAPEPDPDPESAPGPHDLLARALRGPVEAVLAHAERLRSAAVPSGPGAAGEPSAVSAGTTAQAAASLLAAGWRLSRLCDDLLLVSEMRRPRLPLGQGEVDPWRLLRRVLNLAAPVAERRGIGLSAPEAPGADAALLATDESALWSLLDILVRDLLAEAGAGDRLDTGVEVTGEGLALVLRPYPAYPAGSPEPEPEREQPRERRRTGTTAPPPPALPCSAAARALAAVCGAALESRDGAVRIVFPLGRCLF